MVRLQMSRRTTPWLLSLALACGAVPALGQESSTERRPPFDVPGLEHQRQWVPWVFGFLFVAGIVLISIKNPHRGHLD